LNVKPIIHFLELYLLDVSYRLSVDSDRTASGRPSRVRLIFDDANFNNILVRDNRMIRKRVDTCDNVFARVSVCILVYTQNT